MYTYSNIHRWCIMDGEQLDYCLQGLSSKKKSEPKTYAGQPGNEHLSFGVDGGY